MVKFENGEVNATSLVQPNGGLHLVFASQIPVGHYAWTAGLGSPLGKRIK